MPRGRLTCPVHTQKATPQAATSLLCHFQWFYLYIQMLPSLPCPTFGPVFFGAIFPSSPLGCEHPGIRGHVVLCSPTAPGSWWALGGCLGPVRFRARGQEGSCAPPQVTPWGPWPRTISQLDGPGAPCRVEGTMLPEHLLHVRGLSLLAPLCPTTSLWGGNYPFLFSC